MLTLFIILTIANVVIQTIKSIATIKCGKTAAALVNAIAYGLYTYVVFFTAYEGIDLHAKALITAFANLVGVYVVKWCEEKARKDKLWKVEMTIPTEYLSAVDFDLRDIPHSYIRLSDKHTLFNFYCATQKESLKVKDIVDQYGARYFVSESKVL